MFNKEVRKMQCVNQYFSFKKLLCQYEIILIFIFYLQMQRIIVICIHVMLFLFLQSSHSSCKSSYGFRNMAVGLYFTSLWCFGRICLHLKTSHQIKSTTTANANSFQLATEQRRCTNEQSRNFASTA